MFGEGNSWPTLDLSVPAALERQVQRRAWHPAIVTADKTFTYHELNTAANAVAERLLQISGGARQPVATLFPLGAANIVGFLGVLKTGAAVVPLDPHWSLDTLLVIARQCGAGVILTSDEQEELANHLAQPWQRVISLPSRRIPCSTENPRLDIPPGDAAVILHTSGSTGQPKGVVDSHRNLLHEVLRLTEGLGLTAQDRQSVLRANCAGAVSDVCTALVNGAALLPYDVTVQGFAGVEPWLESFRPSIWRSTPSLFRSVYGALADDVLVDSPRIVFLCGEPANGHDLELWQAHSTDESALVNCFGATETATVSLKFFRRSAKPPTGLLPVGRSVRDMEILLEDSQGEIVEDVGEGELLVRSRYLALGYLNDPIRTGQAFRDEAGSSEVRVYRTGDIGQRDAAGELTVLGRRRWQPAGGEPPIDLAVIESALLAAPDIEEAAVIIRSEVGGDQLMVCVVAQREGSELLEILRAALGAVVEGRQVTILLSVHSSLPKTSSGKVDRAALQSAGPFGGVPVVIASRNTPENAVHGVIELSDDELSLLQIWREILGLEVIGIHDNFFDLGGQSIQAAQVISRIEVMCGVKVTFRQFFASPTISDLAILLMP